MDHVQWSRSCCRRSVRCSLPLRLAASEVAEDGFVTGCLSTQARTSHFVPTPNHLPQDSSLLGLRWLHNNFTCDHGAAAATLRQLYLHPDCPTSELLLPSHTQAPSVTQRRAPAVSQRRAAFLRKAALLLEKKRAIAHGAWDATEGDRALQECGLYALAASLWQRLEDGQPLSAAVVRVSSLARAGGRRQDPCSSFCCLLDATSRTL